MSRARRPLLWGAIALTILLVALAGARRGSPGNPLDPASTGPDGTRALVDILEELGARVEVSNVVPVSGGGAVLLLSDNLEQHDRAALLAWVRQGGTLVVADPDSPVTRVEVAGSSRVGFLDAELERRCGIPALRDVHRVSAPGGLLLRVPPGAQGCFSRGEDGSWLVAEPVGDGTVVRLGGTSALVNREIGSSDNAVLAASLLAPSRGDRVVVLKPPLPGGGSRQLGDLVAPRVKLALWQLAVAFVLLALWRGRRLGRPVTEPAAVRIPGSELVVAVGNLLQRGRHRRQAATLLAGDLHRVLTERLGLPASAPLEQVADTVTARTGIDRGRVLAALQPSSPQSEADLVRLALSADAIRTEVTGVGNLN
jgi:Domain of unknown function (DUF4350)